MLCIDSWGMKAIKSVFIWRNNKYLYRIYQKWIFITANATKTKQNKKYEMVDYIRNIYIHKLVVQSPKKIINKTKKKTELSKTKKNYIE